MLIATLIMGVIAVILIFMAYQRGTGAHIEGLKNTGNLLLQVAPMLVLSLFVAGMVEVLIPRDIISTWVGTESGFRGILLGTLAGSITPSGPFVSMPIAAGLLRAGASVGTVVAFMTSWSLLGVTRMPLEIGMMGWEFTLIRMASGVFIFPVLAGLAANFFFGRF